MRELAVEHFLSDLDTAAGNCTVGQRGQSDAVVPWQTAQSAVTLSCLLSANKVAHVYILFMLIILGDELTRNCFLVFRL